MLIGQAGNSWDLQVDHLKMHGAIIEGKLAIWTPGVLNLINTGEERNLSVGKKKKVVGSARLQMKSTCVLNCQKSFLTG